MIKIENVRHSLSHILAQAILELYPKTKLGIGPAIENGFYYDFEFEKPISNEDLPKIEAKMKELIKKNIKFEKKIISKNKAKEIFKNQLYKIELINELPKNESLSIYQSGEFIDLCKGPHIKNTLNLYSKKAKEIINSFKLTKVAGAYWRGSEKNQMLQRIYGIAFSTKKELNNYLAKELEAQKRDHRLLGQKLELFYIDEQFGPGLILWLPRGAILKKTIMDYALQQYCDNGYQLVDTPHIAKLNLWKLSGHLDFYKENMMPSMCFKEMDKEEKDSYQIKPMNCPFHIAIYKTQIRSYKDLPIRYTEIGTVYRYERSGTLCGLVRVRQITQDDAHIICTQEQLNDELSSTLKLTLKMYRDFGFKDFTIYLSTRPEKFIGDLKIWKKTENSLKYILKKLKLKYETDVGGGAFYGPKIDIKIKDSLGREWQCTTIQADFNLPQRFQMTYVDEKGKKKEPLVIHRALLGSMERFIGVLLEYSGGELPLWLAPEQLWIIPISSRHEKYAEKIAKMLKEAGFRFKLKNDNQTLSKKIREGELQKIPYLLVLGDKEIKAKSARIRKRGKGDIGEIELNKFIDRVKAELKKRV